MLSLRQNELVSVSGVCMCVPMKDSSDSQYTSGRQNWLYIQVMLQSAVHGAEM